MIRGLPTTILGIDPGFGRVGYGLIESNKGTVRCLTYGCIETSSALRFDERLLRISEKIRSILLDAKPHRIAIERLYFSKNAKTAIDVSQARGAIILTVKQTTSCPLIELTPLQVKQATTGYGGATKSQIQEMVKRLLQLECLPKPDDAADALAIALTASTYLLTT